MTITQLQYIVAVDTYRSFGKAAKHCYVTQPTLSMQIKKIEEELKVLIFDRSKKPVLTTDIGKQIVAQALIAIKETNRIKELIQNEEFSTKGELRIGIIPTLCPYLLPLFITKFMAIYPDVNLSIEELLSDQIVHKLNSDSLDVGILVTPMKHNSILETPLFYEKFVTYMSTRHPLSGREKIDFKELDLEDMWLLKDGHCFRNQMINICGSDTSFAKNAQLRFESGSLETLRRIVETQYGYTLMPELALMDLNKEKQLKYVKPFNKPQPLREVSLVTHRNFMKKKLIDALKNEILENIPAQLKDKTRGRIVEWVED